LTQFRSWKHEEFDTIRTKGNEKFTAIQRVKRREVRHDSDTERTRSSMQFGRGKNKKFDTIQALKENGRFDTIQTRKKGEV
jgi:hypothetical protein